MEDDIGGLWSMCVRASLPPIRRDSFALVPGSAPDALPMLGVSLLALGVNVWSLAILKRYRQREVHLRAAWIFSATDVQVNLAVMLAAVLVTVTASGIPTRDRRAMTTSFVRLCASCRFPIYACATSLFVCAQKLNDAHEVAQWSRRLHEVARGHRSARTSMDYRRRLRCRT